MTRILYIMAGAAVLGYLIWPLSTLVRFYLALKASDVEVVESMVDWPMVRTSIAEQFNQTARRVINQNFSVTEKEPTFKFKLNFMSVSFADTIAAGVATPEALIFLFSQPTKLHCFNGWREKWDLAEDADCPNIQNMLQSQKTKEITLQGPNIFRIIEKSNYLFFIDPFTFRVDLLHKETPVELILKRRGFSWKITEFNTRWENVIKGLNVKK